MAAHNISYAKEKGDCGCFFTDILDWLPAEVLAQCRREEVPSQRNTDYMLPSLPRISFMYWVLCTVAYMAHIIELLLLCMCNCNPCAEVFEILR